MNYHDMYQQMLKAFEQQDYTVVEEAGTELLLSAHLPFEEKKTAIIHLVTAKLHFSKTTEAISILADGIELAKTAEDINFEGLCYFQLGRAFLSVNDTGNAIQNLDQSVRCFEKAGNKARVANSLGGLGIAFLSMRNYEKALEYLLPAVQELEMLNDEKMLSSTYANLGVAYFNQQQYSKAMDCYEKALLLNRQTGNKLNAANVLSNMGRLLYETNEFEKALHCFTTASDEFLAIDRRKGVAINTVAIAKLYGNKNSPFYNLQKAEELYLQALQTVTELGAKEFIHEAHHELYRIKKEQGNLEAALHHLELAHKFELEFIGIESSNQAQQMDHKRKVENAERDRQVKLARFQEQEKILHNILPVQIADRILEGEKQIADYCENVSIFFSDIVGFTKLSQHMPPHELVSMLNEVFSEFDRIARKHGLEKIKTIGDAYMAVAGLPVPQENHAERAAHFALEVMQWMEDYRTRTGNDLHIRAGLHCGHAVAGVIGENKFAYDLWGDAVNTASRMESHGEPGKIQVSEDFRKTLGDQFVFEERGEMEVKGKGKLMTYFLAKP